MNRRAEPFLMFLAGGVVAPALLAITRRFTPPGRVAAVAHERGGPVQVGWGGWSEEAMAEFHDTGFTPENIPHHLEKSGKFPPAPARIGGVPQRPIPPVLEGGK